MGTTEIAPERWAPRDASWYNAPHISGLPPRWHLVGPDGVAACGHPALLALDDYGDGQPPGNSFKCARCLARLKRATPPQHGDSGREG